MLRAGVGDAGEVFRSILSGSGQDESAFGSGGGGGIGSHQTVGGEHDTLISDLTADIRAGWDVYNTTPFMAVAKEIVSRALPAGIRFRLKGCETSPWFEQAVRGAWTTAMRRALLWDTIAGMVPFKIVNRNGHLVPTVVEHSGLVFKLLRTRDGVEYVAVYETVRRGKSRSTKLALRSDIWVRITNPPVQGVINSPAHACIAPMYSYNLGRQLQDQRNALGAFPYIFTSTNPNAATTHRLQRAMLGEDRRTVEHWRNMLNREVAMSKLVNDSTRAHKSNLGATDHTQTLRRRRLTPTVQASAPVVNTQSLVGHMVPLAPNQIAAPVRFNPSIQRNEATEWSHTLSFMCMVAQLPQMTLMPELATFSSQEIASRKIANIKNEKRALVRDMAIELFHGIFSTKYRDQRVQEFSRAVGLLRRSAQEWLSRLDLHRELRRAEILSEMARASKSGREQRVADLMKQFEAEPPEISRARDDILMFLREPEGMQSLGRAVQGSLIRYMHAEMDNVPGLVGEMGKVVPAFKHELATMVSRAVVSATEEGGRFIERSIARRRDERLLDSSYLDDGYGEMRLPGLAVGGGETAPSLLISVLQNTKANGGYARPSKRARRSKEETKKETTKETTKETKKEETKKEEGEDVTANALGADRDSRAMDILREYANPLLNNPFQPTTFTKQLDKHEQKMAKQVHTTMDAIEKAPDRREKVRLMGALFSIFQRNIMELFDRLPKKFGRRLDEHVERNVQVVIPATQTNHDLEKLLHNGVLTVEAFRKRVADQMDLSLDEMPTESPMEAQLARNLALRQKFIDKGYDADVVDAFMGVGGNRSKAGSTAMQASASKLSKQMDRASKLGSLDSSDNPKKGKDGENEDEKAADDNDMETEADVVSRTKRRSTTVADSSSGGGGGRGGPRASSSSSSTATTAAVPPPPPPPGPAVGGGGRTRGLSMRSHTAANTRPRPRIGMRSMSARVQRGRGGRVGRGRQPVRGSKRKRA